MILPYADYGDIFFINANSKQLKEFQTLKNRALRISLNAALEIPIEMLHQFAQVPMLEARREVHLRNFMFKRKTDVNYLNMRNIRTRLHDAHVRNIKIMYFIVEQYPGILYLFILETLRRMKNLNFNKKDGH